MPVVIHGSRAITGVKKKGVFHCPTCRTDVNYVWKHVRRWGHLYFIPMFPGEVLGEYIECQACMNTYKPAVLEYDPAAASRVFEATYQAGVKRVMVLMMLADGKIDASEVELIRGVFLNIAGRPLDQSELEAEIEAVRGRPVDVAAALKELAGLLNDRGKTAVFKASYLVAAADGTIDPAESQLLSRVGEALELSAEQCQQAIRELNQPRGR